MGESGATGPNREPSDRAADSTAIRVDDLTKRFGDVTAVDGLDLRVREGEVFGFLGPNGAGKSTVINALLDFVRPTSGSVSVLGHDPRTDADLIRRRTGVLPEGGSLYERLTGREHVEWIARANGVESDAAALLDRVGLSTEARDRAVGGYSKGTRRRLAFAMALVGDPDLLILDEPSAGLDPTGMQDFREIILAEANAGRTVFFSSHILGEVEAVCDRIGILNDGRLAARGTPDELRETLDVGGTIRFEVDRVPSDLDLGGIDGVETVRVDGSAITATLSDSAAKIRAATHLADRTRVLDVVSTDASLERLFHTYAGPDGDHRTAPDESRTTETEVSL